MRYLKYLALVTVLIIPATFAHGQVAVGIGVGFGPGYGYVAGPPVCHYGYYGFYPYACAPYGYYGPDWFVGGAFIGAGPWYHSYWGRGFYGRSGWSYDRGFHGRDSYGGREYNGGGRGYYRGGYGGGYAHGSHGGGYARGGFSGGVHGGGGGFRR